MRFIAEGIQLTIELEGFEKLWALKIRLQIPKHGIIEVNFLPGQQTMQDLWGYWRLPGTSLPGIFLAGSYVRRHEREFWYLKMRTPGVMTLTLNPDTAPYSRVRVSCTPEVAQGIADWWHSVN